MNSTAAAGGRARHRLRASVPVVAVATALLVSSCAAGQQAQTAGERPTLDGTYADIGKINLRGLTIDAPTGNQPYYAKGKSAQMRMVIVNTGKRADRLTSISSSAFSDWSSYGSKDAAAQVQAAGSATGTAGSPAASKSVTAPPGVRVSYGTPDANMSLLLMNFTQRVYPGSVLRLTFTFANAGSKTISVPVALSTSPNTSAVPGPSATGQEG